MRRFALAIAVLLPILARAESYALLVGVGQYEKLTAVPFASEDVTALGRVLVEHAGYNPERVTLMTQAKAAENLRFLPDARRIRQELTTLLNLCGPGDTVLIAFAGHGVQLQGDPENFFCPADANLAEKDTLIGLCELFKLMEASKAGVKILLSDACRDDPRPTHVRSLERVKLVSVTRPKATPVPQGVAALFACSEGEQAHSHPDLKHGVFFHFVMEGLKGKAADVDGAVTVDQLVPYLKREVKQYVYRKYGESQVPDSDVRTRGLVPLTGNAGIVKQAENLRMHGKLSEALALLEPVLRADPNAPLPLASRAKILIVQGDRAGADRDLAAAERLGAELPAYWVAQGIVQLHKNEPAAAITACERALKLDSTCVAAFNARGLAYRARGDLDAALRDCAETIRLDPSFAMAYANRGIVFASQNQPAKALTDFTEAIRLEPQLANAYKARAVVYAFQKDFDAGLKDLAEAIRLEPKNPEPLFVRGNIYRALNRSEEALSDFTESIRLDPKNALVFGTRGDLRMARQEVEGALSDFNEAIRLNPKLAAAYTRRSWAYGQKGMIDQSISDSSRAIQLDPNQGTAYQNRGYMLLKKSNFLLAVNDFTAAIRLNPRNPLLYEGRAVALQQLGRQADAAQDLNAARALRAMR